MTTTKNNSTSTRNFPDIPDVTAVTTPLLPGVDQCVLKLRRTERVHLILLPGGLFSITDHAMTNHVDGDVAFALGRLITARVGCGVFPPAGAAALEGLPIQHEPFGDDAGPMSWVDLPHLTVTPLFRAGKHVLQWKVEAGREVALLFLSCEAVMPIGSVTVQCAEPSRPLLTALGRLVIAQSNHLKFGGGL